MWPTMKEITPRRETGQATAKWRHQVEETNVFQGRRVGTRRDNWCTSHLALPVLHLLLAGWLDGWMDEEIPQTGRWIGAVELDPRNLHARMVLITPPEVELLLLCCCSYMTAATTCASSSLAGQALGLSSNALAGKVNVSGACFLMKAKATDTICYEASPVDFDSDSAGRFSDPETSTKNPRFCSDNEVWQLTVGRLLRSGTSYFYERTKDSAYSQPKPSDLIVANYSYQRSEQSKEFKKMHLSTNRKPRAPELMRTTSNSRINGTMTEAIAVQKKRLQQGISASPRSYVQVLQTCMKHKDLLATKQVHACMVQSRMVKNPYVAGTLMNAYIKIGALGDARGVFDQLKTKTVIDWTIMIGEYAERDDAESASELFIRMRQEGVKPDEITYLTILKACGSPGALKWGKQIHECIRHAGFDSDVPVGNALLNMYVKCGRIMETRQVFEKITKRDVITWNTMIGGLAQHGCGHEAYQLFCQMRREGFQPDAFTYASILSASASAGALQWVTEVHGHARKAGLESDLRVGTALVHMYAKSGSIDDARAVFNRMEKRGVITWNVMIGGLAEHGCGYEAYQLLCQMRREGVEPNRVTYTSILNASASADALQWVTEVHDYARKAGLESDLRVGTALVHIYAKSGSIDDARAVFDRMEKRDLFTWTVMIGGLAQHGCGHEAYQLFCQMIREGFQPDAVTYASILNASASAGALQWVTEVHGHARKAGLESDLRVGNALVHIYAKCGSIGDARAVFDRMKERDVVTWTVMIGGLAQHGCGHEALEYFSEMNAAGVKPNQTTFTAVLSACCHAGRLDDGRRIFLAITEDHGIEPVIVHYTCMVDLLGRAGLLEESKRLIEEMPFEPDAITWKTLLGACRKYGNVELGEIAAKELFKLEPNEASTYVLLSNIYGATGKRDKQESVRTMMEERGVRKEPGRSSIEVAKKLHDFVVGDLAHPEAKAIYIMLKRLTEKLKAKGYIPDVRLVLKNIDEEDKESALCSHSEKLAIAYGLMHVPRGVPIHIFKNLRVCSDCHAATKLISDIAGQEIIVRDVFRFHHFKEGVCSCGDYW